MKKTITAIILVFFTLMARSESVPLIDTILINTGSDTLRIAADLDSLVNSWYVRMALIDNPGMFSSDTGGVQYADSVYSGRLSKINSVIKLPYNRYIQLSRGNNSVRSLGSRIIISR
jgi:hypothetical protein